MTTRGYLLVYSIIVTALLIKVVFFSKKNIDSQKTKKLASS